MTQCVKLLLATLLSLTGVSTALGICVAPAPSGTAANYQSQVDAFVHQGCFRQWPSDAGPHLTGATVNGMTYSVHDRIRVYYSPAMLAWLQQNRPDGMNVPAQLAAIPDGAAMVAAVYPILTSSTVVPPPAGFLVMIRQAGQRPNDPASGWFFSQIVLDPIHYGGTRVTSSTGNYSLGLCVACHSSAVNNLTFASFANSKKPPAPASYTPNFIIQNTGSLLSALTPPPTSALRSPLGDGDAQKFIEFFNNNVPEFKNKALPSVASLPMSKVLAIPGQDTDNVYLQNQPAFITSNQCQGCHDSTALLSMQSAQAGSQRQWAPPATSFKYSVQGPGSAPKGGDKFNISQYGEWSVSIMALASRDPAFLSQIETERVLHNMVEPTSVDNFCYRCHGPMGQRQYHIDNGGDPTQVPPGTPLPPEPNFSHIMSYSTPGGCNYPGFPCNQPGAQPEFAKYGGLARDGISCALCHHIGPQADPASTDPWSVFYGFKNPAVAGLEKPVGLPYPFAGSVLYDLTKFSAPEPNDLDGYSGAAHPPPSPSPAVAQIYGHSQNFSGTTTVTRDFMPKGELCGGCHVVIAPEIPIAYPLVRNSYQIDPKNPNAPPKPAMYPNTNTPCPPVKPLANGKYDPTVDPCVQQSFEQTTYLEWAASASFGGATPQTSCTFCHMPNAQGRMMAIANINGPGTVASDSSTTSNGGFPKSQYRAADDLLSVSANASYPRHRLMAINLFVHEMYQQFPAILGISDSIEGAVPPGTVRNLQNAEETILTHAPTTISLSVCKPGTANTPCSNLTADPNALTYQVTVQNFSGHRFPTGAGFRRGFLEFRLLDSGGNTLWVSGQVNPFGAIVDNTGAVLKTEFPPGDVLYNPNDPSFLQPHFGSTNNPAITRQDQVQIYEVRATNEYGKLTSATTRLFGGAKDNRIPPAGWIPPYDCNGKNGKAAPGTADPTSGRMVNGLDGFLLSRITAPEGIDGTDPNVTINPSGAFSDPDFCTPGGVVGGAPSGIAGVDHVLYKIPLSALNGATVAKVQVIMHYQTIPPYFLRDRFYDGQTYSNPMSEGGVVGLGAATERLLYATSHLDTKINNTVPQQQGLPSFVSNNWTMDIGSACYAEVLGVTCPTPAVSPALLPERTKIRGIYK